jgi:sugar phosphate isomerase/epimerase
MKSLVAMKNNTLYTRRNIIKNSLILAGAAATCSAWDVFSPQKKTKYKIGACDWSIGKRNEVSALELAKSLGLDGVQVSLGSKENDMHLRRKDIQQAYHIGAKQHKVQVSSLAIGELNKIPYKSAPETEQWVSDSIDVAKAMKCKVVLLAFFEKGDLRNDEEGIKEVIRRLRIVVPKAESAGITLGIESWLSADKHIEIIKAIGSKNIRVYYDVANASQMGYDIYDEMARLGNDYICEVHAKENGFLLGQGTIDFPRIKSLLDSMNYRGWVIIEGAVPKGMKIFEAYTANNKFLRSVLNTD